MSTKTLSLIYQKDVNGTPTGITGATATIEVIRLSDVYHYDYDTLDFVTPASATNFPMTEVDSVGSPGLYSAVITYTGWQDDIYLFNVSALKTGETPFGYVETITIVSGIIDVTVSVDPAPTGFSIVYTFFNDLPSTSPVLSVNYLSGYSNENVLVPITQTGIYSAITGLIYFTLMHGATVEFKSVSRGLHKTCIIPEVSTVSILSLPEVR
jgi:hypothetical protein